MLVRHGTTLVCCLPRRKILKFLLGIMLAGENQLIGDIASILAELPNLENVAIHMNKFHGDLDPLFCAPDSTIKPKTILADCGLPNNLIKCSCCSCWKSDYVVFRRAVGVHTLCLWEFGLGFQMVFFDDFHHFPHWISLQCMHIIYLLDLHITFLILF